MTQLGRVLLWLGEQKEVNPKEVLNIIVMAHRPPKLLETVEKEWGLKFEKGRQGFYQGRQPPQDVVLVACDELPIEPKYAIWLLFADAKTEAWRKAMKMMARNQLFTLLEEAEYLYPQEYEAMDLSIEEITANFTPKQKRKYLDALAALAGNHLKKLDPERLAKVLQSVPSEERLKGLPPEERVKELTPEEKRRLLKQLQQELELDEQKATDNEAKGRA